jgi:hypothetical protein
MSIRIERADKITTLVIVINLKTAKARGYQGDRKSAAQFPHEAGHYQGRARPLTIFRIPDGRTGNPGI